MNKWTYHGETEVPTRVNEDSFSERFGDYVVYVEDGELHVLEFFGDGWDDVTVQPGQTVTWEYDASGDAIFKVVDGPVTGPLDDARAEELEDGTVRVELSAANWEQVKEALTRKEVGNE